MDQILYLSDIILNPVWQTSKDVELITLINDASIMWVSIIMNSEWNRKNSLFKKKKHLIYLDYFNITVSPFYRPTSEIVILKFRRYFENRQPMVWTSK